MAVRGLSVAVLALLVLGACSSSSTDSQNRATAEACGVFSGHAETKQIEMAATQGQRSGNGELRREATQLVRDLALANNDVNDVPALLDVHNMAQLCGKLGFRIAQGW